MQLYKDIRDWSKESITTTKDQYILHAQSQEGIANIRFSGNLNRP